MIKSNENNMNFWCVTRICGDNKNLSSGLIHHNSIRVLYVSDSFLNCLRMSCQKMPKWLGERRPITESDTTIQKVSIDTVIRLLENESELSASTYDDDHGQSYRDSYSNALLSIWIKMLMSGKIIDLREPDSGVHASEVRKCLR